MQGLKLGKMMTDITGDSDEIMKPGCGEPGAGAGKFLTPGARAMKIYFNFNNKIMSLPNSQKRRPTRVCRELPFPRWWGSTRSPFPTDPGVV